MSNTLYISDGVHTATLANHRNRPTIDLAREYAARYDHEGESDWSVCRCYTDDPDDGEAVFAFRQGGAFEWRTDREYVSF